MPNWCCGDLKVRGKQENIKDFLLHGLLPKEDNDFILSKPILLINECETRITMEASHFYICDTTRHFIKSNLIDVWWLNNRFKDETIILKDFAAAWEVNTNELASISKRYNIDFKIHTFEKGLQFNQKVEIINGTVIKDKKIQFKDYDWDCIRPHIGG